MPLGIDKPPQDNYNIIIDILRFEWDENKNAINKKKHGLSFEVAREVFFDEAAIIFDDPDHSFGEERFLIIGRIKSSKICIVSHCYLESDEVIRLISAREATKQENLSGRMVTPMRDEYDIKSLNPRKNPYAKRLKQQITINIQPDTITYFKDMATETGIPYQTLIDLFLTYCKDKKLKPDLSWG